MKHFINEFDQAREAFEVAQVKDDIRAMIARHNANEVDSDLFTRRGFKAEICIEPDMLKQVDSYIDRHQEFHFRYYQNLIGNSYHATNASTFRLEIKDHLN